VSHFTGNCSPRRQRHLSIPLVTGAAEPLTFHRQRGVLLEELKKKDAVIESLRQMLKPHMLTMYSASEDPSSSSPPSNSATTEEPVRRQVLEWLAKADESRNYRLNFDSKTYDSSDGESESRTSVRADPRGHGRSLSLNTARANKHRSLTRSQRRITLPMDNHPVGLLAKSSLRGSRGRPSAAGSNVDLTSPVEIGVARQDYFASGMCRTVTPSVGGLRPSLPSFPPRFRRKK
jgi:hypothetical protein